MVKGKEHNKKYRVALLSSGLGHVKRGVETWTEDLGKSLYERGIDLTVYKGGGQRETSYERVVPCMQRNSSLSKWIIKRRPNFFWRFGLGSGYTLEELTFTISIFAELIFRNYEIIHTQDPQVADYLRKMVKLGLINSKVILAHGTEEPFEFLSHFKFLQHLAPYHLEEMKPYNKNGQKAYAIGNFVDTEKFKPGIAAKLRTELNIPQDAFVVASVAAIKKQHKRIDYLIEEVSRLNKEDVYLIVAGAQNRETEELIALGKEKLGDRVKFLIDFPHERIHEVYAAADVFTLCSLKEMMPIALLEAVSSGLPAIVHQYPVEEWMIKDGGESIDMSQEGSLSQTIAKYMNKDYKSSKSQKAREQALNNFSKEKIVTDVIDMYQDIAGDKR